MASNEYDRTCIQSQKNSKLQPGLGELSETSRPAIIIIYNRYKTLIPETLPTVKDLPTNELIVAGLFTNR